MNDIRRLALIAAVRALCEEAGYEKLQIGYDSKRTLLVSKDLDQHLGVTQRYDCIALDVYAWPPLKINGRSPLIRDIPDKMGFKCVYFFTASMHGQSDHAILVPKDAVPFIPRYSNVPLEDKP